MKKTIVTVVIELLPSTEDVVRMSVDDMIETRILRSEGETYTIVDIEDIEE